MLDMPTIVQIGRDVDETRIGIRAAQEKSCCTEERGGVEIRGSCCAET